MTNEERLAAELDSQKEYTRIWNERCNRKTEQLIEADKRIVELSEELKRLKSTVLRIASAWHRYHNHLLSREEFEGTIAELAEKRK